MDESEEREICCIIKSGYLEFEWSIITPSNGTGLNYMRIIVKKIQIGSMDIGFISLIIAIVRL
jgi:hypothetical protein